jgi:hypothetical protein
MCPHHSQRPRSALKPSTLIDFHALSRYVNANCSHNPSVSSVLRTLGQNGGGGEAVAAGNFYRAVTSFFTWKLQNPKRFQRFYRNDRGVGRLPSTASGNLQRRGGGQGWLQCQGALPQIQGAGNPGRLVAKRNVERSLAAAISTGNATSSVEIRRNMTQFIFSTSPSLFPFGRLTYGSLRKSLPQSIPATAKVVVRDAPAFAGAAHPDEIFDPGSEQMLNRCDQCGNEGNTFEIRMARKSYIFDTFECAIEFLAPSCALCGHKVTGRGIETENSFYCANCVTSGRVPNASAAFTAL